MPRVSVERYLLTQQESWDEVFFAAKAAKDDMEEIIMLMEMDPQNSVAAFGDSRSATERMKELAFSAISFLRRCDLHLEQTAAAEADQVAFPQATNDNGWERPTTPAACNDDNAADDTLSNSNEVEELDTSTFVADFPPALSECQGVPAGRSTNMEESDPVADETNSVWVSDVATWTCGETGAFAEGHDPGAAQQTNQGGLPSPEGAAAGTPPRRVLTVWRKYGEKKLSKKGGREYTREYRKCNLVNGCTMKKNMDLDFEGKNSSSQFVGRHSGSCPEAATTYNV